MSTRVSLIGLVLMLLALFIAVPLSARAQTWTLVEVASLWPGDAGDRNAAYRVSDGLSFHTHANAPRQTLPVGRGGQVLFARQDGGTALDIGYWPTSLELDGGLSPYGFGGDGRLGTRADPSGMMFELAHPESGFTSYFGAGYREIGQSGGGLPAEEFDRVGVYAVAGFRVAVDDRVHFFTDYRFSTAMSLSPEVDSGAGSGAVDPRASAIMTGIQISF